MKRWGHLKPVRLEEKELKNDLGTGNFIFVGSSCDMWAQNIPISWIEKTLEHLSKFDNKYLFQSKNPERFLEFKLPKSVLCTTIESNIFYSEIMRKSPTPYMRAKYMQVLSKCGFQTYLTIEPIMDFTLKPMLELIEMISPEQINIGANTSNIQLPEPPKEKILALIAGIEAMGIIVHKKSNLKRLLNNNLKNK